jgi:hypothetical protein
MKINTLNIPKGRHQFETHVLLLQGFGLFKFVLHRFGGEFLSIQKRAFNFILLVARRYIECIFGVFASNWRILYRPFLGLY